MEPDLHCVVRLGQHPASQPGQPDDRWMVTPPPTYPRDLSDRHATVPDALDALAHHLDGDDT